MSKETNQKLRAIALGQVVDLVPIELQIKRRIEQAELKIELELPDCKMSQAALAAFDPRQTFKQITTAVGWRLGPVNPPEHYPYIDASAFVRLMECPEIERVAQI